MDTGETGVATMLQAIDTAVLDDMIRDGRLLRGEWTAVDEQGREMACLLAAVSPEAAERHDPSACPAHIMPAWLAYLLPWLDDSPNAEAWPEIIRRCATVLRRLHFLDALALDRAHWRVRALLVREAMRHTSDAKVLSVCERVAALCERRAAGEDVPDADMAAAWGVARAAARAVARAAAWGAASAAASAADMAAAWGAANAAASAADMAAAWGAANAAEMAATSTAASDRMALGILGVLEAEIDKAVSESAETSAASSGGAANGHG